MRKCTNVPPDTNEDTLCFQVVIMFIILLKRGIVTFFLLQEFVLALYEPDCIFKHDCTGKLVRI